MLGFVRRFRASSRSSGRGKLGATRLMALLAIRARCGWQMGAGFAGASTLPSPAILAASLFKLVRLQSPSRRAPSGRLRWVWSRRGVKAWGWPPVGAAGVRPEGCASCALTCLCGAPCPIPARGLYAALRAVGSGPRPVWFAALLWGASALLYVASVVVRCRRRLKLSIMWERALVCSMRCGPVGVRPRPSASEIPLCLHCPLLRQS